MWRNNNNNNNNNKQQQQQQRKPKQLVLFTVVFQDKETPLFAFFSLFFFLYTPLEKLTNVTRLLFSCTFNSFSPSSNTTQLILWTTNIFLDKDRDFVCLSFFFLYSAYNTLLQQALLLYVLTPLTFASPVLQLPVHLYNYLSTCAITFPPVHSLIANYYLFLAWSYLLHSYLHLFHLLRVLSYSPFSRFPSLPLHLVCHWSL